VHYCSECKEKETFFIHKWEGGESTAELKSFERGHMIESQEIGESLEGLISPLGKLIRIAPSNPLKD